MRTNALWLVAVVALLSAACTKVNPDYCADAHDNSCRERDAAASETHDAPQEAADAEDASGAGDANADAAGDAAETKPASVCSMDDECAGKDAGTAACDTTDGGARCVECTANKHCAGAKPVCSAQKCVECTGDDPTIECKAAGLGVCNTAKSTCVQCLDSSKCANPSPVCETTTNACRPCKADSECKTGPGVCVDWDGHCATADEVVTLQGGAGCVASGASFCKSADAVAAMATQSRPILVVKGPNAVGMIEPTPFIGPNILVVGQMGAIVSAGAGDSAGVHVGGPSQFWVRDLKISGGTAGVVAEMTGLHLTRCTIVGNTKGGLTVTATSFDITNSIIAANGMGTGTGAVAWGGVHLGPSPQGSIDRFASNTIVDNLSIGVACEATYDTSTNIIHGNQGGESVNCSGAPCCGPTNPDPKLDATTYHLLAGSPCVGQVTQASMSVTVDIDGQARPAPPAKVACGADEP